MNILRLCKRNSSLDYLDALWSAGRRQYSNLRPEEKAMLTGLIMRETPKFSRGEFIYESDMFDDVPLDVAGLLIAEHELDVEMYKEMKEMLIKKITNNAIAYCENRINQMFETKQELEDEWENERRIYGDPDEYDFAQA